MRTSDGCELKQSIEVTGKPDESWRSGSYLTTTAKCSSLRFPICKREVVTPHSWRSVRIPWATTPHVSGFRSWGWGSLMPRSLHSPICTGHFNCISAALQKLCQETIFHRVFSMHHTFKGKKVIALCTSMSIKIYGAPDGVHGNRALVPLI